MNPFGKQRRRFHVSGGHRFLAFLTTAFQFFISLRPTLQAFDESWSVVDLRIDLIASVMVVVVLFRKAWFLKHARWHGAFSLRKVPQTSISERSICQC
jgi:hypothetical protein